jgi:hypothetical protein
MLVDSFEHLKNLTKSANPAHQFDGGQTGVQLGADSSQHTEIRSLSWKDAEDQASLRLGITARSMTAVG